MITLICGTALSEGRSGLLASYDPADTVYVTADPLRAAALTQELYPRPASIQSADDIFRALLAGCGVPVLAEGFYRALVRHTLETDSRNYDRLFGSRSAPRLTEGVLSYIVSALNTDAEHEGTDNPREAQLRRLKQAVEQKVEEAGFVRESLALKQVITALPRESISLHFPDAARLVFVDFPQYSDSLYLLISAAARAGYDCQVLLDYHPEDENYPGGPLDSAYMVLYEMADKLVIHEDELPDDLAGDGGHSSAPVPCIVDIPNVSREIEAAVLLIQKMLADDPTGQISIVVGVPQSDLYQVWLKEKIGTIADKCTWIREQPFWRRHLWQYLLKLAICCSKQFTVADLAGLMRSRYFSVAAPNFSSRDFASKLELLLAPETEFRSIADLEEALRPLIPKGDSFALISGGEASALPVFMGALNELLEGFRGARIVSDWASALLDHSSLLLARNAEAQDDLTALCENLSEISRLWPGLSDQIIHFDKFLRLLKTSMPRPDLSRFPVGGAPVIICDYIMASAFRSDVCLLLGCNDGNLPRFSKPEAVFLSEPSPAVLQAGLARQFDAVCRCRDRSKHFIMFVPQHEGTEELLESQYIEPLAAAGAIRFSIDELMTNYQLPPELPRTPADELALCLRDVELTESDLKRFRKTPAKDIAHSIFVSAQRSANRLTPYDGQITDPALKAWLQGWSNRHIYSISQLDKSIGCSFRFFAERILNLNDEASFDELISSSFYGSFVHDILAYFYRDWVQENKYIILPDQELEARKLLVETYHRHRETVDIPSRFTADLLEFKMFGELGADGFAGSEQWLIDVEDSGIMGIFLMMEIARAVEPEMEMMIPSNFEVGFGLGIQEHDDELTQAESMELPLPHGEVIRLRGRIDRIDVSTSGRFVVTDYKTGILPQRRQLVEGFKTQLPIYTLVAEELLKARFTKPESAGGLYYSLKRAERNKVNGMFLRSQYKKALGVTGNSCLSDEDYNAVLDRVRHIMSRSIKDIREGRLNHTPYEADVVCPFCPLEKMCYRNVERMAELLSVPVGEGEL